MYHTQTENPKQLKQITQTSNMSKPHTQYNLTTSLTNKITIAQFKPCKCQTNNKQLTYTKQP